MALPDNQHESFDITNCDREPIHLLGRVQSYGFLVAVTSDWLISHVSANIGQFVAKDAAMLIGAPVSDLVDRHVVHQIRNRLQQQTENTLPDVLSGVTVSARDGDARFDISVHVSGGRIILEFEPSIAREVSDRYVASVQQAIQRISALPTTDAILKFATSFCSAFTGFDRVMAYVFRTDETGEVRAESVKPGMSPYLGLRYPASDIPRQARRLYIRMPVRTIDDSMSAGSPILPEMSDLTGQIDLSRSVLRSVSPVHLEYLQNMGVAASFSLSIVVDDALYGLIACHHRHAMHLPQTQRNALVLFSQMLSLVIAGKIAAENNSYATSASELIGNFSRSAATTGDIASVIMEQRDVVMELMHAQGLAVVANGSVQVIGNVPSGDEIRVISKRLNALPAGQIFHTNELSRLMPEASDFASRAAGMLSVPISKTPRDYILFFRPEVVKTVTWAGNPDKPVTPGPNGVRLTPRKSFEAWRSLVEGQSEDWSRAELAAAEQFRVSVLEVVLRMADEAALERKKSAEKQELLIAELNHRVRNILGLVRSLIAQTSKGEGSVSDFASVLESRVRALARAHDQITRFNWSAASLKELVATESEAYLDDKASRIVISGPDADIVPAAYATLALVMHEMITNSAKYGSLSDSRGRVELNFNERDDGSLDIDWREMDGPPVKAPDRRGFGSTIIERSIPFELHGESQVDYALTGLKARFWIPAMHVARMHADAEERGGAAAVAAVPDGAASPGFDFPSRILVVEDNMIIAIDTEGVLLELGAQQVSVSADVQSALDHIAAERPDFAVLDVNLGNETSFAVANELTRLGVPFVFASGYGDQQSLGEEAGGAEVITKPYDRDTLRHAIRSAMSGPQSQ